jgi:hypothetical protein
LKIETRNVKRREKSDRTENDKENEGEMEETRKGERNL